MRRVTRVSLTALAVGLVGLGVGQPVLARSPFDFFNPSRWFNDDDDWRYRRGYWGGPWGGGPWGNYWGGPWGGSPWGWGGWGGPWGYGYPWLGHQAVTKKDEAPPPPKSPE